MHQSRCGDKRLKIRVGYVPYQGINVSGTFGVLGTTVEQEMFLQHVVHQSRSGDDQLEIRSGQASQHVSVPVFRRQRLEI